MQTKIRFRRVAPVEGEWFDFDPTHTPRNADEKLALTYWQQLQPRRIMPNPPNDGARAVQQQR